MNPHTFKVVASFAAVVVAVVAGLVLSWAHAAIPPRKRPRRRRVR